ncbi:MAG: GNAT family N-acetyltransferase [Chloroflexi bacterium]|nr:GNAT family N-acetyltransferase [Chloroflexota bacterium]
MIETREISSENIADLYAVCIPPQDEFLRAGRESGDWFVERMGRGSGGFVAYEDGKPVGRVEFHPLEESLAAISGDDLYFVPCINVAETAQKKGCGRALMEEVFEATADRKGVVTVAAEGWMPKEFFLEMGFEIAQQMGPSYLLLKKHQSDARCAWMPPVFSARDEPDRVNVEVVMSYQCPYMLANYRKLMTRAGELSDKVEITEYVLSDRESFHRYGEMNLYIDGQAPFFGPGSEDDLERIVKERLEKKGL